MANKSSNVYVRIEPEVKEQAEHILDTLGLSASSAINLFYKQIIMQNGLPFDVKIPAHPLDMSKMSQEELDTELQKGYDEYLADKGRPAREVFDELYKEWNV